MPISLSPHHSDHDGLPRTKWLRGNLSAEFQTQPDRCITIGLVNNMPDGALKATERQFLSLLDSASGNMPVRLLFYSLAGISRDGWAARHVNNFYSSVEDLRGTHLDGLIVTGREPLAPNLADEPYWESFTEVLEWARNNTYSTVWSCLAAHAAILHMDGIGRIRSDKKHFGVFESARLLDHPLMTGAPSCFQLPHSRWNGIPEDELTACGYSVLTRSADIGVDTFIKRQNSLFVFFQGHPEYESRTLLLEYRRDVGRYLRGEITVYPLMPRSYFDRDTAAAMTALQNEAMSHPREELLAEVSAALEETRIESTWHSTATCIYRNWLEYICAQKQLRSRSGRVAVEAHVGDGLTPLVAAGADISHSPVYAAAKGPSRPVHGSLGMLDGMYKVGS